MDITIAFHRSQWENLSEAAKVLIGTYCGPLWPDKNGVLTMVLSETAWEAVQRAMKQE